MVSGVPYKVEPISVYAVSISRELISEEITEGLAVPSLT
jgi:hypothetical protein